MEDPFVWVAIAIAIGSVIGLIVQSKLQSKQLKQTENNQYDETLRKLMSDLYEVYRFDIEVKTKDECELFATRLLDILAVVTHLYKKRKISSDKEEQNEMLDFVYFDLRIGKGVMEWFHEKKLFKQYNVKSAAEIWTNLDDYFKKNEIKKCAKAALPHCIKKYDWFPSMLFVYGTLITDETRKDVLGRDVSGVPATLDGYDGSKTVTIEKESYPAAEKKKKHSIQGLLIEVTPEELEKLDAWETDAYRRKEIELTNGIKAWIYLNKNSD